MKLKLRTIGSAASSIQAQSSLGLNCPFTSVKDEIHMHASEAADEHQMASHGGSEHSYHHHPLLNNFFSESVDAQKGSLSLNPKAGTTAEVLFSSRGCLRNERSTGQFSPPLMMLQVLPLKCWGFFSN